MNRLQANLCLLCVTLCWSAEVVLYACIPDGVPAFATSAVTALAGAALLFVPFHRRVAEELKAGGWRFVAAVFGLAALSAAYNTLYLYQTTYDAQGRPAAVFYKVDLATLQATPILLQHAADLHYAYGINIDPASGNLYICNSPYNANADLYTFQPDGTLIRKVEGGILASKVVF